MWRFFGQEDGNAQSCMLDGIALHGIGCLCRKSGIQAVGNRLLSPWVSTEHSPKHSHVHAIDLVAELIADSHFPPVNLITIPPHEAHELSCLLFKCHA